MVMNYENTIQVGYSNNDISNFSNWSFALILSNELDVNKPKLFNIFAVNLYGFSIVDFGEFLTAIYRSDHFSDSHDNIVMLSWSKSLFHDICNFNAVIMVDFMYLLFFFNPNSLQTSSSLMNLCLPLHSTFCHIHSSLTILYIQGVVKKAY